LEPSGSKREVWESGGGGKWGPWRDKRSWETKTKNWGHKRGKRDDPCIRGIRQLRGEKKGDEAAREKIERDSGRRKRKLEGKEG